MFYHEKPLSLAHRIGCRELGHPVSVIHGTWLFLFSEVREKDGMPKDTVTVESQMPAARVGSVATAG